MIASLALLAALAAPVASPTPIVVDVVISAGHEGRPESCSRFPRHKCNLGAAGERQWTPIVADAATRVLRAHGVTVARLPADFDGTYDAGAAVFIHFDGNDAPCSTGASIGYHRESDKPAAAAWRALYARYFPYRFMSDDFTTNLQNYDGFRQMHTTDGALVIELGEVTCPQEKAWLAPRLEWEGELIAYFLSQRIGKGDVPDPGPFQKRQSMIEVFYRYRVHPAQVRAFEHAYGVGGPWAKLFARHPGFRRTRLFRHAQDPAIYVTIDVWETKADWDGFRADFSAAYAALDRQLALLKIEEHLLGFYDGTEEYRPPLDARA